MDLRLLPYTLEDEVRVVTSFREMMADEGESFSLFWNEEMGWADFVQRQNEARYAVDGQSDAVPTAQLKAIVDAEVVGRVSIRFKLSEELLRDGGHIGYYVLPQFRGRGYATEMLRQSLIIARAEGVQAALLMCNEDNAPSAAVIERCGGALEAVAVVDDGRSVRRYWIREF